MPGTNGVLIRFGEVFLKRDRKRFFLDKLDANLRRVLRPFPELDVRRPYGRFVVQHRGFRDKPSEAPPLDEPVRVIRALSRVFGVTSLSPVTVLPADWEVLQRVIPDIVDGWLAERPAATFGVATRRSYKRFPKRSMDINRELGAAILERRPELKVHLDAPDLRVGIEVREEGAFVHGEKIRGPGGLPVGSNGKVLALLSGGIDSPVAIWSILRRGVEAEAVYFHSFPYTSDAAKEKVAALARQVGRWQGGLPLHVVPFTDIQRACRDAARPRYLVLLYRRFMFRIAQELAHERAAAALVTGESLGQVASQTLPNLHCIESIVDLPVLRPLIAHDKQDTITIARRIGTYDISIQPHDDCCSLFVPKHPELRGREADLLRAEARIDGDKLVREAIEATERL